jgi:hypothetical protein
MHATAITLHALKLKSLLGTSTNFGRMAHVLFSLEPVFAAPKFPELIRAPVGHPPGRCGSSREGAAGVGLDRFYPSSTDLELRGKRGPRSNSV